ncbi:MAG: Na+/H+ antiporter, partial [Gemmatimonadetes bacterium]|nr:Na+/H+ antiporter [Gemmatimonadota bacterium]
PTPYRAEILIITVVVIIVTLVLQGLTLVPIITRLPLPADPGPVQEEGYARTEATRAALEHLADLRDERWASAEELTRIEQEIRLSQQYMGPGPEQEMARAEAACRARLSVVAAKRRAVIRLRDEGAISDEVLLDLESELDYEALRLGAGEERDE